MASFAKFMFALFIALGELIGETELQSTVRSAIISVLVSAFSIEVHPEKRIAAASD
jgi:hypothetical protein